MRLIAIFVLILALTITVSACSTVPQASNNTQVNTSVQNPVSLKITDARYINNSFLISGDTLDDNAKLATNGFNITKSDNLDGTTTFTLTSSNPEYRNQTYTLQQGQQLYFVELNHGDDINSTDSILGDDRALITDADGNILNAPNFNQGRNFSNETGRFGNMTSAERQQLQQQMTNACNGRIENDSCSVTTPNGNQNGTCIARNSTLFCAMQRFNRNQ
jgi:hypothetical protein